MESPLKQRLIGAAVLAALAIIFLPMLLKGPDVKEPDAAEVPLSMPATPGESFETRELPLTAPEATPGEGGVLGMTPAPVATDATGTPETAPGDATTADATPANAAASGPARTAATTAPAAAAPTPKPSASTAGDASAGPAVAAGDYALTVGTFANAASATALVGRLRAAGLPVASDHVRLASGDATRVRVGPFASRAAAEAARQRVEQISGAPSKAVVLDAASAASVATRPAAPISSSAPAAKSTTTAATAPTTTPRPASGYAVQLSAPSVEADANALRDRARAAGFAAFVQRIDTDSGARYRVRLGPTADRAAAETLQADAKAKLGNAGIIVSNP